MSNTSSFCELLASGSKADDRVGFFIGDDWLQGRTTYGGLSAALALHAARRLHDDLPPLRSATVSFVGPAAGPVVSTARILRRGRSVSFVEADLTSDGRIATRCGFAFGAARDSAFDLRLVPAPQVPEPDRCSEFLPEQEGSPVPAFTRHFEARLARGGRPITGSADHEHLIWVRHRDRGAIGEAALLAVADMPPPAILPMFEEPAPISSMTWLLNIIEHDPDPDGWWLLSTRAEHAANGYSSQDMLVWTRAGQLAVTGRQSVALFA
ncbi:MAG: thioesterase family protein [Deltaproteobacteria bacterium]|nr:thioesterase family protein [Deltaproteobacteria bacterium]